jgi:hypothetical protein
MPNGSGPMPFAIDTRARGWTQSRPMSFFGMPRGDRYYLLALIATAFVAFLPWSRATHVGVLPVFAWIMAGLMVVAPLVALLRLLGDRGRRRAGRGRG